MSRSGPPTLPKRGFQAGQNHGFPRLVRSHPKATLNRVGIADRARPRACPSPQLTPEGASRASEQLQYGGSDNAPPSRGPESPRSVTRPKAVAPRSTHPEGCIGHSRENVSGRESPRRKAGPRASANGTEVPQKSRWATTYPLSRSHQPRRNMADMWFFTPESVKPHVEAVLQTRFILTSKNTPKCDRPVRLQRI
jgi:hypothetical protein